MTSAGPTNETKCPRCGSVHPVDREECSADVSPDAPSIGQARTMPEEDVRDPLLHARIGSLTILRQIGGGGMGTVYLASNLEIQSQVAVKVLKLDDIMGNSRADSKQASLDLARERFLREAKVAAKLGRNNPGIVQILDYGHLPDGRPYMVMEYLHGRSLDQWLQEGLPPAEELRRWLEQLCDALIAIHEEMAVHRDLKPENIWIAEPKSGKSSVKLIDFGISKVTGVANLTLQGEIIGSPKYMPPERLMSQPGDALSDVYSFGVLLHEIATGRVPFDAESLPTLVTKVLHEPAPALVPRPGFTSCPELETLVRECLAKTPAERPQSMAEVKERLLAALDSPAAVARPPATLTRFPPTAPAALAQIDVSDQPATPARARPAEDPGTRAQLAAVNASRRRGIVILASTLAGFTLVGGGYLLWKHLAGAPTVVVPAAAPAMAPDPPAARGPATKTVPAPMASTSAGEGSTRRRRLAPARRRTSAEEPVSATAPPLRSAPATAGRIESPVPPPSAATPQPPPATRGTPGPALMPLPEVIPQPPSRKLTPSERDLITDEKILIGN